VKILHYMPGIPPVYDGGMIRYASDLMAAQKNMGIEVLLLYPGVVSRKKAKHVKIVRKKNYGEIPAYELCHALLVPTGDGIVDSNAFIRPCTGQVFWMFFHKQQPDLVHIHSLMGLPREFLYVLRQAGIPSVYTTHDYFGICPIGTALDAKGENCHDTQWKQCGMCCQNAYSIKRLRLRQSWLYRQYRKQVWLTRLVHKKKDVFKRRPSKTLESMTQKKAVCGQAYAYAQLRKYYQGMFRKIDYYHFNSTAAQQVYRNWLGDIKGSVINISHAGINDRRSKGCYSSVTGVPLKIAYFGNYSVYKGFYDLLAVCRSIYRDGRKNLELHVYSDTDMVKDEFVKNHPHFRQDEREAILKRIDVLVMPSRWVETFGLAALEAASCGVPVIFPKTAGIWDVFRRHPDACFSYEKGRTGLKQCLEAIYDDRYLLQRANQALLSMDYDFSYRTHVIRILALYNKILQ